MFLQKSSTMNEKSGKGECTIDILPDDSRSASPQEYRSDSPTLEKAAPKPPKKPLVEIIREWTPFTLVVSYYVFSVCLYVICTEKMIGIFWFIYLATNFYISSMTVLESFLSLSPIRDSRRAISKASENGWVLPTPDEDLKTLDLIIVAYLPNEKDIIMDRARYLCEQIVYPRHKININVLYNTPKPIEPLETDLHGLTKEYSNLRVIQVPNSTSKADNLNFFLNLDLDIDVIAIYDCDHYPHPHGPRWAMERFSQDDKVDIVQGRCVVFNTEESFLSAMVSVEFDKIYAVSHPGRAAMWGFGLFCGSNGFWKADLLKELKMDGDMLTEDIDSALRAVTMGKKTVHDLNVLSFELAPTTFSGFWKQRLRWAQGWTQASMKHIRLTWAKPEDHTRDVTTRFGILTLLFVREWTYYLVTQYTCLVLSFLIVKFPSNVAELSRLVYFQYSVSQWLFFISIICLIATLLITNYAKSEFAKRWHIIVFSIIYPFYLILNATIGIYGHARQLVKYTNWNPTART